MGMVSIRFDDATEDDLRRAADRSGLSVSDFVRTAVRRTIDLEPRPTLLERLGDAVGRFDSAEATTQPDELGDYLQAEHERQAAESRALRRARDAR
jgi:antitoxin component of RelBE/YafQ-DinJ toxin-antitoxin module